MHPTTILSVLTLLFASSASAAAIRRDDPHVIDFRTWGSTDCGEDNQGIWTFTQSQADGECKSFSDFGADNVKSISLVDIDAAHNHTFEVWWADGCPTTGTPVFPSPDGACFTPPAGSSLKSFKITG